MRWLRHPALWSTADEYSPRANEAVTSLAAWFADQEGVTLATCRALGCTAHYPDGGEWPNPFASFSGTVEQQLDVQDALQAFTQVLVGAAKELNSRGALIDPGAIPDLVTLAQLLLLKVDRSLPVPSIVDRLNILPRGGWLRQGQLLLVSDINSSSTFQNLGELQRDSRRVSVPASFPLPERGRPRGSGAWNSAEEFTLALEQAVVALRRQGIRPTQEAVAQYFSAQAKYPNCDDRQLRRWCRDLGVNWSEVAR